MKKTLFLLFILFFCFGCTSSDDSSSDNGSDNGDDTEPTVMDFYVWDLSVMPPEVKTVTATLRAEGDYSYIFVDNDEWDISVNQTQADTLVVWFEDMTPEGSIDPNSGIYYNDVDTFGEPPDTFDNDPKIYILLTELASYSGTQFDGYFNIFDQMSDEEAQQYGERSNEKEILYINSVIRPVDDAATLSVIGHEFVHMIQSNYDSDEMWVEETLAELGMLINGYYTDVAWVHNFLSHPNYSLLGESQHSIDYGACLLWGLYLHEQIDEQTFFREVITEETDGIYGFDAVLDYFGYEPFLSFFFDWLMANYLDDPTMGNGQYGYTMIDIPEPATTIEDNYPSSQTVNIHRYGAKYIRLENIQAGTLWITIEADSYEDIFIGILEYIDATNWTFDFYPLSSDSHIFTFENPEFTELPIIVTSVSDQATINVNLSFDIYTY